MNFREQFLFSNIYLLNYFIQSMTSYLKKCVFFLLLFPTIRAYSQTDTTLHKRNHKSISVSYLKGNIITSTKFLRGDNLIGMPINKYQSVTINMLWQNSGYYDWQKVYRAPYYGAGISLGDVYDPLEVGYPISFFGVLGIPVKRWNKLEIYSEYQFGLATNWKCYHPLHNPKNMNVGAHFTFHVNIGMSACYSLSNKLDIGAGFNFVHFSNGGVERPNKGFNIYGPRVELKYHLDERLRRESIVLPGRLERSNDLFFMISSTRFQMDETVPNTDYYGLGGFSLIYFTQLSNAIRLGFGADLNCWKLLSPLPSVDFERKGLKKSLGFILQPEIIFDKLTLVTGLGIYVLHPRFGSFNEIYQRLGIRYEFYNNMTMGMNVRGRDFYRAEYMEFNLGYRIRWKK